MTTSTATLVGLTAIVMWSLLAALTVATGRVPPFQLLAMTFAIGAEVPATWDCPRCGNPAGRESGAPPGATRNEPYKTHLAYVKERRSDDDGAAILEEALLKLRQRRGEL